MIEGREAYPDNEIQIEQGLGGSASYDENESIVEQRFSLQSVILCAIISF